MTARAVWSVVLAAVVWLAKAGCGGDAGSTARNVGPPPAAVEAITVEPQTLLDEIALVGQLDAEESVLLKPEIDGVVDTIEFQEGQEVESGALLLRLRDDWQRAALAEAEADLRLAMRAHERATQLSTEGVVAAADFDRLVAERDVGRARVERARVDLARTQIFAPFAGMLGRRLVSPGDRVSRETAMVQLDAVARLKLVFTMPEMAIRAVRVGMPVTVRVAPWPDQKFPGEVYFVAPTVDPATRRVLVQAIVPNPSRVLRPGLFANVDAEVDRREAALVVPESALVHDTGGAFVWRIEDDGTAARTPVQVGLRRSGTVEIVQGLAPGNRIVTAGTHKLAPGAPVRVVSADKGGASEARP